VLPERKTPAASVVSVADGIVRVTFPLPLGIDHVHCYLLRASSGAWILVDTGLGLPGTEERWGSALDGLDAPVERIVITHGHPDHVGDAAPVAELTGAPVLQGRLDNERSREVWGGDSWHDETAAFLLAHGMPPDEVEASEQQTRAVAALVHLPADPEPLDPGESVDGWEVVHLPGHADGHLALLRDGTLIAGDAILDEITPTVGVYPRARPDPLADFLRSLEWIADTAPEIAFAGHGQPIRDPARRARELVEHHRVRADLALAALERGAGNAHEVSLALWPDALPPVLRRFAVTEALAHLDRLAVEGRVLRGDDGYRVR